MNGRYILDGHTPVPCEDLIEWAKWMENIDNCRVALTEIGPYTVSTVFLGLDHQWYKGPPVLFETMILLTDHQSFEGDYQIRCSTWDEALAMHTEGVKYALARSANGEGSQTTATPVKSDDIKESSQGDV
jgi:hypothetical protein